MTLDLTTHWGRLNRHGDTLSFWAYSDVEIPADASPLINVSDAAGEGSPSIRLLGADEVFPGGKWMRVRLPFASFSSIAQSTSDAGSIPLVWPESRSSRGWTMAPGGRCIWMTCGSATRTRPAIRLRQPRRPDCRPGGYDRHVDLAWARSAEPDLLHYKIYRSVDGGPYVPIAHPEGAPHPLCGLPRRERQDGVLPDQRR